MTDYIKRYVSINALRDVLASIPHAAPVGIVTSTEPKMRKTGNPYVGRITKITEMNVFVNCKYEDAVNRQRVKEGKAADFVAQQRSFGERVYVPDGKGGTRPSCLITHTLDSGITREYVETRFLNRSRPNVTYMLDGRAPIEKALFQEFLQEGSRPTNQGLDAEHEVIIRTYMLRSLIILRWNGIEYHVV